MTEELMIEMSQTEETKIENAAIENVEDIDTLEIENIETLVNPEDIETLEELDDKALSLDVEEGLEEVPEILNGKDEDVNGKEVELGAIEENEEYGLGSNLEGDQDINNIELAEVDIETQNQNKNKYKKENANENELPCMIIEFDSNFFLLFNHHQALKDQEVLYEGQSHLFISPLTNLIKQLKTTFDIKNDVTIEFPQLELSLHQDATHVKVVKLEVLYSFHKACELNNNVPEEESVPLKIVLFEHQNNFVEQYNHLLQLCKIGSNYDNSIILTDQDQDPLIEEEVLLNIDNNGETNEQKKRKAANDFESDGKKIKVQQQQPEIAVSG